MENKRTTIKQDIASTLMNYVYNPAQERLNRKMLIIADRNAVYNTGNSKASLAFIYKGDVYSPAGFRPVGGQKPGLLNRPLYDSMEEYLQEFKEVEAEKLRAWNYFAAVAIEASNQADLMALLPDCLHSAIFDSLHHRPTLLSDEHVHLFREAHAQSEQMLKERLVINLIS